MRVGIHADLSVDNLGDIANGGFIIGTEAVAVIDPGGSSASARALERALRERTELPVTHLVLTHFHPDHVLGAHVFADNPDTSVETVAHAAHARAAVQRGAFYLERYAALVDVATPLRAPTLEVAPGEPVDIDLGGRTLRVRAHAVGHTDNDVSVHDAAAGVLWAGDLVFAERTPSLDGSLRGWLAVMDELAALGARTIVPGHGAPGPAAALLAPQRRYLETLLGDVRAAIARGDGLAEAVARAERAPGGDWALFALHHPANVTRAWTELEWE